jgi:hypothetical protein
MWVRRQIVDSNRQFIAGSCGASYRRYTRRRLIMSRVLRIPATGYFAEPRQPQTRYEGPATGKTERPME